MKFPPPRRLPWLLLITGAVIVADRITKIWVTNHIPMGGVIPVIPHVLGISHWLNEGAAFSLFANSASPGAVRWGLISFTILAALAVLGALFRLGSRFTLTTIGLALILGGAIGNVHDRIAYGSVVDFIEVHIFSYHWPDFNIADSSIVVGACLLLLDSLLPGRKPVTQEARAETGDERSAESLTPPGKGPLPATEQRTGISSRGSGSSRG